MKKKSSTTPEYAVPALDKGLDILETLAQSETPLTLSSLARLLGRANTEIFRMLNRLESRGYVLRDNSGGYRLSLKLFQLARVTSPLNRLLELSIGPMRGLANKVGQTCHLSIIESGELVVIATADPPTPIRLSIAVGSKFDIATTASGRALLTDMSDSEREALLASSHCFQKMKSADKEAFKDRLKKEQPEKCHTVANESFSGVIDYAATIGNPSSGIHAAIAIPAILQSGKSGKPQKAICQALISCVEAVESVLISGH